MDGINSGMQQWRSLAYSRKNGAVLAISSASLICAERQTICTFSGLKRFLDKHIAHATYDISDAKIEGINNKIKTIRRQGDGYPDDEYYFLKLFDMNR